MLAGRSRVDMFLEQGFHHLVGRKLGRMGGWKVFEALIVLPSDGTVYRKGTDSLFFQTAFSRALRSDLGEGRQGVGVFSSAFQLDSLLYRVDPFLGKHYGSLEAYQQKDGAICCNITFGRELKFPPEICYPDFPQPIKPTKWEDERGVVYRTTGVRDPQNAWRVIFTTEVLAVPKGMPVAHVLSYKLRKMGRGETFYEALASAMRREAVLISSGQK